MGATQTICWSKYAFFIFFTMFPLVLQFFQLFASNMRKMERKKEKTPPRLPYFWGEKLQNSAKQEEKAWKRLIWPSNAGRNIQHLYRQRNVGSLQNQHWSNMFSRAPWADIKNPYHSKQNRALLDKLSCSNVPFYLSLCA